MSSNTKIGPLVTCACKFLKSRGGFVHLRDSVVLLTFCSGNLCHSAFFFG